jgi:SAM-dependent methyltransferase
VLTCHGMCAGTSGGGVVIDHDGFCPICSAPARFVAREAWLRDFYLCERCRTLPRQRAVVAVLDLVQPDWRSLGVHESSPSIAYFAEQCQGYTSSFYLEGVPPGSTRGGRRCEDLERLTFADESFDVFLTQDVLEHVFEPDRALAEIARVLRRGGVHVFTTPKHKDLGTSRRRAALSGRGVEHLLPPVYHGNPVGDGRSLVTWDYGCDFDDLAQRWSGYLVSDHVLRDRNLGIDGEFLDVFVMRKDRNNRLTAVA